MNKSVENVLNKNISQRATLRGLKKCPCCGFLNGMRALICRNQFCNLRKNTLETLKPFDPVKLITLNQYRTQWYSLRSKEKLVQPRSFVSITDTTIDMDTDESATAAAATTTAAIISKRATCFVENCKYSPNESNMGCKHLSACSIKTDIASAEVYAMDKGILWNLNIPDAQKQSLWELYQKTESQIPPIQKINSTCFVVACEESASSNKAFLAGRLHVNVFADVMNSKKGTYSCVCKKLRICLEADDSVTMKKEICDHIMLVLAGILSHPLGKTLYATFLEGLQSLWMPLSLNLPVLDCNDHGTLDFGFDQPNSAIDISDHSTTDDLFNFTEDLFTENNIPDFSDITLDVNSTALMAEVNSPNVSSTPEVNLRDPTLYINSPPTSEEDVDYNFPYSMNPDSPILPFDANSLCSIEPFPLVDGDIQMSNDNLALAKDIEALNDMVLDEHQNDDRQEQRSESPMQEAAQLQIEPFRPYELIENLQQEEDHKHHHHHQQLQLNSIIHQSQQESLLPNQYFLYPISTITLKKISRADKNNHNFKSKSACVLETTQNKSSCGSSLLQQSPVKIIKIPKRNIIKKFSPEESKCLKFTTINNNKIMLLNAKTMPIVPITTTTTNNNNNCNNKSVYMISSSTLSDIPASTTNIPNVGSAATLTTAIAATKSTGLPTLGYESWLDSVIEVLNDSITIDSQNVRQTFHVHQDMFSYFSKTLSLNNKRRLPNSTTLIKTGKHKGLVKYVWYLNQSLAVQNIFSTENTKLELERCFERVNDDTYELFEPKNTQDVPIRNNFHLIFPKTRLRVAQINFSTSTTSSSSNTEAQNHDSNKTTKCGLKVEWVPMALPKSQFGLMTVEFCVSVKETQ